MTSGFLSVNLFSIFIAFAVFFFEKKKRNYEKGAAKDVGESCRGLRAEKGEVYDPDSEKCCIQINNCWEGMNTC